MALVVRNPEKPFEVCDVDLEGVEDGDAETFYTLRPLTRDVILEIESKHTRRVPNKVTHRKDDVLDERAALEDKLDYLLVGWRGIVDERDGSEVPCTREWKLRAINGARQVALFRLADVNRVDKESRSKSFRAAAPVERVLAG